MVSTLNELSQLKQSGFGQPQPRHGLNLLYWFAQEYISVRNGKIVSSYSPEDGDFGFHRYYNRIEDDDDRLLPSRNLLYYEVGNLNARGADKLPGYVRASYSPGDPDSNKDRVIVCQGFSRVYVTEHSDQKQFDSSRTYRVSLGLLQIIRNMSNQKQYLEKTANTQEKDVMFTEQRHVVTAPEENSWGCTIL
ncbi:uncharacterized protein LOC122341204 isoform X2 [Puntigrus tetrazona]|nr:uncharacterized protein LOC122341204 isoform X2 [Puntigrus tetrazona]XP_043090586.1 uncharacterized protein LOC122341204 isoform X2 [Puntigrus tetrazona]XP_043090591.1 uncharacterized protein LOC122341204 isoform X2 [Puntigrus tetrazona]XP_043090595.1 uncharacterized protein LOC122341204 isoform X2 [Puntigrus tetrazona]